MSPRCLRVPSVILLCLAIAAGRAHALPPDEGEPLLRLEAGGPISLVTALGFSPDGETLYEAGWDKVVRVWTRDAQAGAFRLDQRATYRVPIGPGLLGAINALALSPDGTWLAVAGNGVVRGGSGFRRAGLMVPPGAKTDEMRRDQGTISVFHTRDARRGVRLLRGHLGPVLALAFAPARAGGPPVLVSAARESDHVGAVRLWDVATGQYLGGLGELPDPATRPGLALWSTAPVRVAVAWEDGSFRLWDAAPGRGRVRTEADGRFNNALALLPGRGQVLTSSFDPRTGQGQLRVWDLPAGAPPRADAGRRVAFPPEDGRLCVPRAMTLVSSRPGGAPDHAAVVLVRTPARGAGPNVGSDYVLQLVDLDPRGFGAVKARVPLWTGEGVLPTLAAAPGGRHLAIAGGSDREVAIYAIADLLQGRAQPQRLRGAGAPLRRVAFVRNGPDWGLLLNAAPKDRPGEPPRAPAPGDLVFDVTRRRVTTDLAGWDVATPAVADWQAGHDPAGPDRPGSVWVRRGEGPQRRIGLKPDQVVTDYALLPPRPPRQVPIVAVASHEFGEPSLALYDGASGEQVRQLTGHAERIGGLAFSDDGRLLASTAEDQTVCVWSLTDLDNTLGRRGRLPGVAVTEGDGGLVVAAIEPDAPARADDALQERDLIQGLVEQGKLRPLASVADFYNVLSLVRPAAAVTLRRIRAREGPRDVTLRVGQGVDERKPLWSLFVTRGDAGPGPGWIGWSPLGPYEASDRDVERLLGWHFNTGDLGAPTRFALADQYRRFFREGVLKELLDRGGPAPPAAPPPLPRPKMSLTIDPQGDLDGQGHVLARRPPASLTLTALDKDLTADQVEGVRWQVDGSAFRALPLVGQRVWSADLSGVEWNRGVHRVLAVLRTREATPQEFSEERLVRFQPPPPAVEIGSPRGPLVVDRPEFTFEAEVRPAPGRFQAGIVHRVDDQVRLRKDWEDDEPLKIRQALALEPGVNAIEFVAMNADALPGSEELETRRLPPLVVIYNRAPARPPDISLEAVVPLPDGSEGGRAQEIGRDGPVVVGVPRVRVDGRIAAEEKLARAERVDGAEEGRPLARFVPDREATLAVEEVLDLAPGRRTYRFRAKGATSDWAEARVTIDYRPPVPELADLVAEPREPVLYRSPGQDPPRVLLRGRLIPPSDRHPYQAAVLVNGQQQPDPPVLDEGAGTLTAEVGLQPGDNQVQVRLSNQWAVAWVTDPVRVSYRRPPRVVALERPAVGASPLIDVSAAVETPGDLPLTRAQVRVEGGGPGVPEKVIDDVQVRREGQGWVVSARNVPIEPGRNTLRLWAWNAEGRSPEPGLLEGLVYEAPPPPKPEVEFLSPARDATVGTPEVAVEFRVRSSSPLEKVELVRLHSAADRQVLFRADGKPPRPGDPGPLEVRGAPEVALERGANHLQVVAVNAGGEQVAAVVVSYVPPPVRIVIDRLEPRGPKGREIVPVVRGDNRVDFAEPAPHGQVWIDGRVIWPDAESLRDADAKRVQVWVNYFPQVHAALEPRAGRALEREFRAGIVLNREDNRVEVKLPECAREAGDHPTLTVGCLNPERRQRLHLLIVGVGRRDPEELRGRALRALHAQLVGDSRVVFQAPAFVEGRIYGPLYDDVRATELYYQLDLIRRALDPRREAPDLPNEVVALYYQGNECVDCGRPALRLRTGRGRNTDRDTIGVDDLARFFAGTRGAQVFLLDVTRSDDAGVTPLVVEERGSDTDSRVGLLRSTWWGRAAARPADAPPDVRLLAALEEVIPRATTLREVVSEIATAYGRLVQKYPNVTFDRHLPAPLSDLVVGSP